MGEIASLFRNETFRALFEERDSPVVVEKTWIEGQLLTNNSLTEGRRQFLQGKLAGINAVLMLVEALHERTRNELHPDRASHRQEPRPELAFLPRGLQGKLRAFPARRAAQGGR